MTPCDVTEERGRRAVRIDSYPIDRPGSPEYEALVARCRAALEASGCCSLPDFVTPAALEGMTRECAAVAPSAHYSRTRTNVYFGSDEPSLPESHPKRRFFDRNSAFVPADCLPEVSALREIYDWPPFRPFIRDCLGEPDLYNYADPLADVIVNVVGPGEEFPWHFDTNDFSISILTSAPEAGGRFEYVPNLRTAQDENYDGVSAVLDGERGRVVSLDLKPGDLQIFKGRFSMHRVTRVEGAVPRHVAIYSYARTPNMVGRVARTRQLYGKVLPVHLEAEEAARSDGLLD